MFSYSGANPLDEAEGSLKSRWKHKIIPPLQAGNIIQLLTLALPRPQAADRRSLNR
jgi:hypothetical protein